MRYRVIDIAKILGLTRKQVDFRIKAMGFKPRNFYTSDVIDAIREDYSVPPNCYTAKDIAEISGRDVKLIRRRIFEKQIEPVGWFGTSIRYFSEEQANELLKTYGIKIVDGVPNHRAYSRSNVMLDDFIERFAKLSGILLSTEQGKEILENVKSHADDIITYIWSVKNDVSKID